MYFVIRELVHLVCCVVLLNIPTKLFLLFITETIISLLNYVYTTHLCNVSTGVKQIL